MRDWKQEAIQKLVNKALAQGLRVFIAERGTYGFLTNEEGNRVVSFQFDFSAIVFSGNYKTSLPKQTGSGWRITDGETVYDYTKLLWAVPPQWAVDSATWKYTTLDQHLSMYGKSSKYQEVFGEERVV